MREKAKKLLYLYQRFFWYVSIAKGEILKPLGFWNETLLILTFLTVRFKFNPFVDQILVAYILALLIAGVIGKIIVMVGIVKYNAKIGNHQNPEFMELYQEIKDIKDILKNKT